MLSAKRGSNRRHLCSRCGPVSRRKVADEEWPLCVARSDTHAALSVVSGNYRPKGPRILSGLVDLYGYRFDAARALDSGRKAWAPAQTGIMTSLRSDGEGANGMGERKG